MIDISTTACLFEFDLLENVQRMVNATVPGITMRIEKPFYWVVYELNNHHTGHSQPFRDCEKNMYLTYQMKATAKAMADSGCSQSDIADFLTSRGCSGTLTNHRLKYAVDVCRRDMEDFTVIAKGAETDAEALIRVLQEKKCRFIYLYTNAPEDTSPSCMELMNSEMTESIKIVEGQRIQGGFFSTWLSKLAAFFGDTLPKNYCAFVPELTTMMLMQMTMINAMTTMTATKDQDKNKSELAEERMISD